MRWALRHYVILGDVVTNIPFLRDVLAHPRFAAGDTTTDFVDECFAAWQPAAQTPPDLAFAVAALAEVLSAGNGAVAASSLDATGDPTSPWQQASGFRMGGKTG